MVAMVLGGQRTEKHGSRRILGLRIPLIPKQKGRSDIAGLDVCQIRFGSIITSLLEMCDSDWEA